MPRITSLALFASLLVVGCSAESPEPVSENLVLAGNPTIQRQIGEGASTYQVLGAKALGDRLAARSLAAAASAEGRRFLDALGAGTAPAARAAAPRAAAASDASPGEDSLVVGYPTGLLDEQQVFGGVITRVSDSESEDLGVLKLSDLTPIHVRTVVTKAADDKYVLALLGCVSKCGEGSPLLPLVSIPVLAVDTEKKLLLLDLAALGQELNLVEIMDPKGEYTKLKTVSSKTVSFDYSLSTLVFDVEVKMEPKDATRKRDVTFVARWYLKLASAFTPGFTPRVAAPGVGFFMTERAAEPKIKRFARASSVGQTSLATKYYVKNVPEQFKPAFQSAFDAWNARFTALGLGKIFDYEFVDAGSAKANLVVAGDIRYHVVEWDLDNKAPYGGFGPSIGNQYTGEIVSANVLIQGPTIVSLYSKWFHAAQEANELRLAGRVTEANEMLRAVTLELRHEVTERAAPKVALTLGESLPFTVGAQTEPLEDPLFQRDDFDPLPEGMTYEKYMFGYFHEMLSHELGHNLGLRHNFRGNLVSKSGPLAPGSVSDSIMEYLGRDFRYVNDLGAYDEMAIKYGYLGVAPEKLGLYCTDEDVADEKHPTSSPECSRDDATSDPFAFFEARLARAVDLLVAGDTTEAPVWTVPDMEKELKIAVQGMGLYASSAEKTGATWTNFFTGADRPASPAGVKAYVLARLKARACDPALTAVANAKGSDDAKKKTEANLAALRQKTAELLKPLNVFTDAELTCGAL